MKKTRKYIFIVIGVSLLIYIIYFFYDGITNGPNGTFGIAKVPPDNYVRLFNKNAQNKLSAGFTAWYSLRDTISYFTYDKKYSLQLTKIRTGPDFNFTKDIKVYYTDLKGDFPKYTIPFNENSFTIHYKGTTEVASHIYLSLNGDSVRTILKNDTIACYYLNLKNVYLQFKPNSIYEIYIEANKKLSFFITKKPVVLILLKRNNSVYFLLLTVNDSKDKLDPGLLYKLINF